MVAVTGEIDLLTAPQLRDAVALGCTDDAGSALVIDLSAVTFLGSSGLAELVEVAENAARNDRPLRVVVGDQRVRRPLEITGLVHVLAVYDSLDDALSV